MHTRILTLALLGIGLLGEEPSPTTDPVLVQHARLDQVAFEGLLVEWDGNGDGTITEAELGPGTRAQFVFLDANGDGVVDSGEFAEQRQAERKKQGAPMPIAEVKDQSYGPHERHTFDLWLAPSDVPTPLVIYIHGGGFKTGDKDYVRFRERESVAKCFRNGVSFAAINYRLSKHATLDEIMLDAARAVQFLRLHADEYNLDPAHFAAYGHSAGGGMALWLGAVDDRANPLAEDALGTMSTRLDAVGHISAQASYDFERWAEIFQLPMAFIRMGAGSFLDYYGAKTAADLDSDDARQIRSAVDLPSYLDKDDAHLFIENLLPTAAPDSIGAMIHHPRHAIWLKQRCDEIGLTATLTIETTPTAQRTGVIDFFLQRFATLKKTK